MINRGKLDQPVREEFEHLIMRLRGFLSQSFDEDGQLIVADPNFAVMPIGGIAAFAGREAPVGYLFCDGAQVSRVTYKGLFDVIGVSYGGGDGSTTFTLPDLRDKFARGNETPGLTGGAATAPHTHPIGGAATVTIAPHSHGVTVSGSGSTANAGFHSHTVDAHAHSIPAHAHDYSGSSVTSSEREGLGPLAQTSVSGVPAANSPHTHTSSWSGTTANGGNGTTGTTSPGTTGGGDHAHTVSISTTGTTDPATATATAALTGDTGSTAVPTVPPYVTVQYLIYAGVFDEAALRRRQQARL